MKVTVNPTVQIGCITFDIKFDDVVLKHDRLRGSVREEDQTIRLSHKKPDQTWAILCHELTHQCANDSGLTLSEGEIAGFATLLAQAIQSLGITPDFSKIPEHRYEEIG